MDQLLQMIQSADPTDNQSDSIELLQLEGKAIPVCIGYFNLPIMFLSSFKAYTKSCSCICLCDLIILCF